MVRGGGAGGTRGAWAGAGADGSRRVAGGWGLLLLLLWRRLGTPEGLVGGEASSSSPRTVTRPKHGVTRRRLGACL